MMATLFPVMLGLARSTLAATVTLCALGALAGVRTPASSALGLDQLRDHPAAMSSARTATTQCGYLLGALVGGLMIAGPGYGPLGALLALVMIVSAGLVTRIADRPPAGKDTAATPRTPPP